MAAACGPAEHDSLTLLNGACSIRGMEHPLERACAEAGGMARLAAAIGQSPQTVWNWRTRGVPVIHCAAIEQATGGKVTRRDLRPEDWQRIWPELADAKAA